MAAYLQDNPDNGIYLHSVQRDEILHRLHHWSNLRFDPTDCMCLGSRLPQGENDPMDNHVSNYRAVLRSDDSPWSQWRGRAGYGEQYACPGSAMHVAVPNCGRHGCCSLNQAYPPSHSDLLRKSFARNCLLHRRDCLRSHRLLIHSRTFHLVMDINRPGGNVYYF